MACTLAATNNLEEVYELEPTPPLYLNVAISTLAWILATHPDAKYRNGAQALGYAQELIAIQSTPSAWLLHVLAASYAEVGNFPKAVDAAQRTLKLANSTDQQRLAQNLRDQLLLYEAKRPCHVSLPEPPHR